MHTCCSMQMTQSWCSDLSVLGFLSRHFCISALQHAEGRSQLYLHVFTLQLSLRRQQVSEKLNEWTVFNEKYKELCEWLTNMESKVSQNGDISIEEMIEKLHKVNHDVLEVCH